VLRAAALLKRSGSYTGFSLTNRSVEIVASIAIRDAALSDEAFLTRMLRGSVLASRGPATRGGSDGPA